jgi:hypothetical protein
MANLASIRDIVSAYRATTEDDSLDLSVSDLDYNYHTVSGIRRTPSDPSRSRENRSRDLGRFQARRAKAQGGIYA